MTEVGWDDGNATAHAEASPRPVKLEPAGLHHAALHETQGTCSLAPALLVHTRNRRSTEGATNATAHAEASVNPPNATASLHSADAGATTNSTPDDHGDEPVSASTSPLDDIDVPPPMHGTQRDARC